MKLNLNNNVKFHNKYELEVIDAATGQKKQTAIAENVVTTGIWNILKQSSPKMYGKIALGTGTGTPSAADTALFNQSFAYAGTFTMLNRTEQWPTCSYTVKVSIPATTSYVGTFTEIGLCGSYYAGNSNYYYPLWSHAMLKDAEGNQITITKTDLDILTITATIYVTFSHTDNNFIWMTPGAQNIICNVFRNIGGGTPPFTSGKTLHYCSSVLLDEDTGTILQVTVTQRLGSSAQMNESNVVNVPSVRMGTGTGNDTFYNAVLLGCASGDTLLYFGGIVFPNTSIFPNQVLAGMNIGVGDGTTKEYTIPLPHFLENTDVVYVDGVKKTRGVDYTLDNVHESVSSASDLSEFLVPISGLETAVGDIPEIPYTPTASSHYQHSLGSGYVADGATRRPLFSRYLTNDSRKAMLKSYNPFIYHATSVCPSKKVNTCTLKKFGMSGYVGSYDYAKNNKPLMVYEERPSTPLHLVRMTDGSKPTTVELQEVVATQLADPNLHPVFRNAGDLVRVGMHMDCYRRYMKAYNGECFVCATHKSSQDSEEKPTVFYYALAIGTTQNAAVLTGLAINSGNFQYNNVTYYWNLYQLHYVYGTVDDADTWITPAGTPKWTAAYGAYDNMQWGICYDGCKIKISGSNNQKDWTLLNIINIEGVPDEGYEPTSYSSNIYQYGLMESHSENTTEYTYYKVELDISAATSIALRNTRAVALAAESQRDNSTPDIAVLSYAGANLVFTEPPAEGAIIKMDATIDRPYKNANFVIDAAMTLSFGGA